MACTRSRAVAAAAPEIVPTHASSAAPTPPPAGDDAYERRRDERIRENLERLQKLGIVNLALKLKSESTRGRPPKRPYSRTDRKPSPALPSRRSSRLQTVPSVSYSERRREAQVKRPRDEVVVVEEGAKEEVYTEEHDKLLGRYEEEWVLFVDGCGKDGRRIYDQVNGKTCHQCRQKTLGHRTRCSKCDLVQGQFCGDCLFMRYGENVLEAKKNPDWICPVCRRICNCSLCRVKKGWAPTGPLYKRVRMLGFKSVAHYLIQTKREKTLERDDPVHVSAKRSLTFKDDESDLSGKSSIAELKSERANEYAELHKDENEVSASDGSTVSNDGFANGEVGDVVKDPSESSAINNSIIENPTVAEIKESMRGKKHQFGLV